MTILISLVFVAVGAIIVTWAAVTVTRGDAIDYLVSLDARDTDGGYHAILAQPAWRRILAPNGEGPALIETLGQAQLQRELAGAGLDRLIRPTTIMVASVAGAAAGIALGVIVGRAGLVSHGLSLLLSGLLLLVGGLYPRVWVRRRASARARMMAADLPDFCELVAMAISAGLSIDAAISAVIGDFDSPVAEEMQRYLDDVALGTPRRRALDLARERTEVPEFAQLLMTLSQADELGLPIASVLRGTAADGRRRRQQRTKEEAAKIPVKMLLPLVLFVFPPILAIILVPAMFSIGQSL